MNAAKRSLTFICLLLSISLLFSCGKGGGNETPTNNPDSTGTGSVNEDFDLVSTAAHTFDYFRADLSDYLTLTREDYVGLRVSLDVTEDEITEYINDYLLPEYRTPKMATDRAVKENDTVYVYYTGYVDDYPVPNGSNADDGTPYSFVVGSGDFFFADVENQLIGKIPSSTSEDSPFTTADVVFPDRHAIPKAKEIEYDNLSLAGKTARFEIVLVGIADGDDLVTDREIRAGDTVAIYYDGIIDDAPFNYGSNAEDDAPFRFVVGSGDFFFAGLENELIGKIPSETSKEQPLVLDNVTFPADHVVPKLETKDYTYSNLVGKTARFKIEIVGIIDGDNTVTDRAIAAGDTVSVYYTGYVDDYAFEGGSNADEEDPAELGIGSGSFIPGFEDALIGVKPADTSKENPHRINVTFPADYRSSVLSGKPARFDVVIVGIFDDGWIIPELTPGFITDTLKFKTDETDVVAAFRSRLRSEMRDYRVEHLEDQKSSASITSLLLALTFGDTLPAGEAERVEQVLNDQVTNYYMEMNYMYYMYYQYVPFDSLDDAARYYYNLTFDADWRDFQHQEAIRLVRQMLVLNAIARLEGVTVTEEEVKTCVRNLAENNNVTPADVLADYSLEDIYAQVAAEKARQILIDTVTFDYGELPIGASGADAQN